MFDPTYISVKKVRGSALPRLWASNAWREEDPCLTCRSPVARATRVNSAGATWRIDDGDPFTRCEPVRRSRPRSSSRRTRKYVRSSALERDNLSAGDTSRAGERASRTRPPRGTRRVGPIMPRSGRVTRDPIADPRIPGIANSTLATAFLPETPFPDVTGVRFTLPPSLSPPRYTPCEKSTRTREGGDACRIRARDDGQPGFREDLKFNSLFPSLVRAKVYITSARVSFPRASFPHCKKKQDTLKNQGGGNGREDNPRF